MMLSLRTRIFIVVSLIVLFILGVSIFLYVRSKNKPVPVVDNTGTNVLPSGDNTNPSNTILPVTNLQNVKVPKTSTLETQQKAAQNMAKIFVERLNSYSSESRYQNMLDVESLATPNYWKQLSAKIPANIPANSPNFYAVSLQAYSATISSWTDNAAIVGLQVKITEEKGGTITKRDAQAKVNLVKSGDAWLVDNFTMVK
ncbi:MAG: hypothetical protein NT034_02000, partial [Candidatus Magasanikbacteria bacterium]|nr:hypothetical protein [Candidatus Magasanikbacteria bacterium]